MQHWFWIVVPTAVALLLAGCQSAAPVVPTQAPTQASGAVSSSPAAALRSAPSSPSPLTGASPAVASASPAASVAAAASPSAVASGATTIDFNAVDFGYTLPDTVVAGEVSFVMHNAGTEAHHAQFIKLNDGVTFDQFTAALKQNPNAAFGLGEQVGGNGALNAGSDTDEVTLNLQPGSYVVLCFLSGADGVPHVAKGMLKLLTVTPAPTGATSAPPSAAVNVTLRDFGFDTSAAVLPSGRTTWQITNTGPQTHELQVARLPAGGSANDILAFFNTQSTGAPPSSAIGGFQGIQPTGTGYLTLDLTPGQYAFYCALPDPNQGGLKHVQEGMLKQVTVQ